MLELLRCNFDAQFKDANATRPKIASKVGSAGNSCARALMPDEIRRGFHSRSLRGEVLRQPAHRRGIERRIEILSDGSVDAFLVSRQIGKEEISADPRDN
jgi:hypothetical protein